MESGVKKQTRVLSLAASVLVSTAMALVTGVGTARAESGSAAGGDRPRGRDERLPIAVVYLVNWGASDLRISSFEDLARRPDVELRIYDSDVARRLREELRRGLACEKVVALPHEQLRLAVRFLVGKDESFEEYLASPQRLTSMSDGCHKKPDEDFVRRISRLFMWADPFERVDKNPSPIDKR